MVPKNHSLKGKEEVLKSDHDDEEVRDAAAPENKGALQNIMDSATHLTNQLVWSHYNEINQGEKVQNSNVRDYESFTRYNYSNQSSSSHSSNTFKTNLAQDDGNEAEQKSYLSFLDNSLSLEEVYNDIPSQELCDGEDVAGLLNEHNAVDGQSDILDHSFLSSEHENELRARLFENETDSTKCQIDWNHILNFRVLDQHTLEQLSPSDDGRLAEEKWIDAWDRVLKHYHDDVWGDIRPIVADAQDEIQAHRSQADSESSNGAHELPALRRLRAILNHIRHNHNKEKH